MRLEEEIKLDFSDVLIRPKRSTLVSRKEAVLTRKFKFKHTDETWEEIGHRMTERLQQSLVRYPTRDWSTTLKRCKEI